MRSPEEARGEPLVGSDVARRLVSPREDVHDALPALLPMCRRRSGSSRSSPIARAYAATSFGST